MPKLKPQCVRCGSPVTNSVESQIEQHEKIKFGRYIDNVWMCDDCISGHKKREENNVPMREKSNNKQHDVSDVSPNTPEADESG
jgi:Zn-finger protein